MNSRTLLLSALALCLVMTACGDETPAEGNNPTPDAGNVVQDDAGNTAVPDAGIVVLPDGGVVLPDAGVTLPDGGLVEGARVLAFNGTSPVGVTYGQAQTLAFTLTADGSAVSAAPVRFTLQGSGGSLSALSVNTNAQGIAQVLFTGGTADADLILMASADRAVPVAVSLQVRVNPLGTASVAVAAATSNRIPVASAEISLVVTPAGQTAPTCASLLAATEPPVASNFATLQPFPGTRSFSALPHNSKLVAYVRGLNANGLPVAIGCAEGATVVGGSNVGMSVTLTQLPTDLSGDMDALVKVNLSGALPEPYEGYLNLFGNLVSNPAGVATYYVLAKADDLIANTPALSWITLRFINGATLDTVLASQASEFAMWRTISTYVDGLLAANQTIGPVYTKVKTVGGDVNSMVRNFEVGSRFHVARLADPSKVQVTETWQALVYTWAYDCTAGDEGCRRHAMQMSNTDYAFVNESYGATLTHAPSGAQTERFQLALDGHNIPLRYGAIVLLAVNELVIPRVTNCETCNSVTDLLTYVVHCDQVGTAVSTWINDNIPVAGPVLAGSLLTPTVLEGVCTSGLATAGAYVENKALELVANNVQELGTAPGVGAGGTFYLVDADKDLKVESLQDLSINVAWYDPQDPSISQQVAAPMTGAGRLAATDCGSDADCAATESCQAIPSYLKVLELETTCKHAVGSLAGNTACTSDTQCRSGFCAAGYCFQACDENVQCSSGVCDAARGLVDLDTVLAGLGDAPAQGCAR